MMKVDLIAYDRYGQLAVIVEVKNLFGKSKEWAIKLRHNIYAHGILPPTPFFLLALPDRFYLWKNAGNKPEIIEPDYETEAGEFLKPYYDRSGLSQTGLSETGFEFLLFSWMLEVMYSDTNDVLRKNGKWITESGLFEAIREGRPLLEADL